jgi:transcriptional regulator GlxA family with amidase domain
MPESLEEDAMGKRADGRRSGGVEMLSATRKIVLIAFDGFQILDVAGPLEVFTKAGRYIPESGPSALRYEMIVASPEGGIVTSNSGLQIAGTTPMAELDETLDTVIVAGGSESALRQIAASTGLLAWIEERAPRTRRLASVCTGAFLLAAAGLLNGRRATTHWSATGQLGSIFPRTQVEPDAIFVGDGHIYTSAGVTAGIDLSLAFIEQDCGALVALNTARELVLYFRRVGGQSQFSASLAAQAKATDGLRDLLAWIEEHPAHDLSIPNLAERAGMSERTFARSFTQQTGMTPARYVELVRLDRAKQLLESTKWPLARIAERSGLGSAATLARLFRRQLGVTPDDYRARFRLGPGAA